MMLHDAGLAFVVICFVLALAMKGILKSDVGKKATEEGGNAFARWLKKKI